MVAWGDSISRQQACQKFIFKIHSTRLRRNGWKLTLPLAEARRNDELISLADSQVLRWIDELNGFGNAENVDARAREIKARVKQVRKLPDSAVNRRELKELYAILDEIQFKPDYMSLIIDKNKDYYRACKGFQINGITYKRLLGTNGGIKNSTIVFVSERLADELRRRIDNGRDMNKPLVTAKLEAYKALTCSASVPVSEPNGILVVPDCVTHFSTDMLYLTDEGDGEPMMEERKKEEVELNASDGFGLMCPELAERWSRELGLDYVVSGVNSRYSFEKGMVFTFDFRDFADEVAGGKYTVTDAWGNEADIRHVELILTTSMLKLWDCYASCDDYLRKSKANGYTFGVAKTCPKELENERCLNYQFIQSYDLDDGDIEELIAPTMDEIRDILSGDWRKTILYVKGTELTDRNIDRTADDFAKAVMVDRRMLDDPYVQSVLYQMIRKRINEAKVGVLKVHGNYSVASGDPYALCQSIFGMEVTGLLGAGEIYNRYWCDAGADRLVCFRAPMTCHNNIRAVRPANSEEIRYWYRYMTTCTVFNAWDLCCASLNGMDFDGDIVLLTDNPVLLRKHIALPALVCAQRKAEKTVADENAFVRSNIASFGNDIGRTTNWITSMFAVRSRFSPESPEYRTLTYRIQCGQTYQQNSIDRAKGVVCKPMPRYWHDRHALRKIPDEAERDFARTIIADKKPYFMRYIYPSLMKQYNTYISQTDRNALREFEMTVDEMRQLPYERLTERQKEFLRYYEYRLPVDTGDCVMNKICRRFEEEFDGYLGRHNAETDFDYRIMRSGAEYGKPAFYAMKQIYEDYRRRLREYAVVARYERVDDEEAMAKAEIINEDFLAQCGAVCSNADTLCDILLDLCYAGGRNKKFVWDLCSGELVRHLLQHNGGVISFPSRDEMGELTFRGERFSVRQKQLQGEVL